MCHDASADRQVGRHFGVAAAPLLSVSPLGETRFSVTHLSCPAQVDAPRAVHIPAQFAYFLMLYLRDADHCDIEAGGVETPVRRYREGAICLVNLAQGASIRLHSDLEALGFYLPYDLLHEVGRLPLAPKAGPLRCLRGSPDRVIWNIGHALLPMFEQKDTFFEDVLRPIAVAACTHLMQRYSRTVASGEMPLSVWQEKDAKEFMADHLHHRLTTADIAEKVGMSATDFADAFTATVGVAPDRWFTVQRIDRVKDLLADRQFTLGEIAAQCGFAGEAQMSGVFFDQTGLTPEAWRRSLFH